MIRKRFTVFQLSGGKPPLQPFVFSYLSEAGLPKGCNAVTRLQYPCQSPITNQPISILLPLNSSRGLTANVVHHPVNAPYIINNFIADVGQKFVG